MRLLEASFVNTQGSVTQPSLSSATRAWLKGEKRMLIGGAWLASADGRVFQTLDPASGEVLAYVPQGTVVDVNAAVAAARKAFDEGPWPRMTPAERAKVLWRVADLIDANIDELAELETLDQGKPF